MQGCQAGISLGGVQGGQSREMHVGGRAAPEPGRPASGDRGNRVGEASL
ncbi:hypothetical protein D554_0533 [Bordetella holmesii 30539]|uniref:Uncharacterized protein n=2 Tax=Bordetella holmesii TaxID=35814 RepID=A0A158M5S4_9BORD|nr:hypothetical protein D560_1054 [Bordetella holmesii ATCC 51541]AIT25718.1 hypothetical protein D558_1038 [Bordetella holmesii 44057]EWM44482.1 hypothetical protein D556_1046 [Bordetella holmesii 41130]EWM50440.1 hypothetical protein D557_0283 [Bordetella holmesii 70147]EXF89335.1 hypothetical protein D554_0533 [Bordetella holmesii 30539]EXX95542.1 hypothetical protein D559_2978 [Bordetella holmesii 1058]KAK78730.1 hypothetical protein L503_2718 [Bordetella holmesii CDC-H809-BH]KAK95796.1 